MDSQTDQKPGLVAGTPPNTIFDEACRLTSDGDLDEAYQLFGDLLRQADTIDSVMRLCCLRAREVLDPRNPLAQRRREVRTFFRDLWESVAETLETQDETDQPELPSFHGTTSPPPRPACSVT
jgi:hypothetical protein